MKHLAPRKGALAKAPSLPPSSWPNGSGVFTAPGADGRRTEIGRVVPEDTAWRIWRRVGDDYLDMGTAPTSLAAMQALPDPAEIAATAKPAKPAPRAAARAAARLKPGKRARPRTAKPARAR
ncbi:MAG: hypothetical protein IRY87_32855 [Acetobacteraceae bacterium]|nr:hypothetical protein [Acetobacteraceae bacterium]MBX6746847.1 hypothetical protein [Acetobacteraceae bacterium]